MSEPQQNQTDQKAKPKRTRYVVRARHCPYRPKQLTIEAAGPEEAKQEYLRRVRGEMLKDEKKKDLIKACKAADAMLQAGEITLDVVTEEQEIALRKRLADEKNRLANMPVLVA